MRIIRFLCFCFPICILLTGIPVPGIAGANTQGIDFESTVSGDALLVLSVPEQSVYQEAGLREMDRITGIDFVPIGKMSPLQATAAISSACIPGNSIILSVIGPEGTRLIRVSAPSPDPRQEAFLKTEHEILEAWEISIAGWAHFIAAACEFALGGKDPQDLFRTFRSSRSTFSESRNRLISVEIPSLLPPEVRSSLSRSKSRLADANTIRCLATRILYRCLVSGENPVPTEDFIPTAYFSAYLSQSIKSHIVSETGVPGLDKTWDYLRTIYLQTRTPGSTSEPLPETLAKEANMAVKEAKNRLERISDLGALLEEALSYTVATEYEAATLIGGMLLRYSDMEKKANVAAGEGFGHLIKARAEMELH